MRSGHRFLTVAGLVGLVGGAALALAPTAGAGTGGGGTELFASGEPGAHAGAAEVPPDICFVTVLQPAAPAVTSHPLLQP